VAEPAPPIARTPADLVREVWLVLLVSLGRSAVYAVVYFTAALTAGRPLAQSAAPLNSSRAPGRPTLDLTYQLLGVFFALVPVALAWHFLRAAGERPEATSVARAAKTIMRSPGAARAQSEGGPPR